MTTVLERYKERALQAEKERDTLRSALDEANIQIAQMEEEYEVTADKAIKERDELRAQVALLQAGITQAYRAENRHKIYEILGTLKRQTPAQAAQYVQGLEAAIQETLPWVKAMGMIKTVARLEQALVAKEQQPESAKPSTADIEYAMAVSDWHQSIKDKTE